jgi:hypothetical protein
VTTEEKTHKRPFLDRSGRRIVSVTITPRDLEILDWLTDMLHVSKSEVFRAAFRNYAAKMAMVERELKKHHDT